jgi:Sulfatase
LYCSGSSSGGKGSIRIRLYYHEQRDNFLGCFLDQLRHGDNQPKAPVTTKTMVVRLMGEEPPGSSSFSRRSFLLSSSSSIKYLCLALLLVCGAVIPNISKSMTLLSRGGSHMKVQDEDEENAMNVPLPRAWFSVPTETLSSSSTAAKIAATTWTQRREEGEETMTHGMEQQPAMNSTTLNTGQEATTTTILLSTPTTQSAAHETKQQEQQPQKNQEVMVQITGETKEVPTAATTQKTQSDSNNQSNDKTNEKTKPLNILILYPDDWRHDTIGKENSILQTPFLDSLADQGIRFRQNAVTSSICWVSRATLFTGQWASRHQSHKLICPHFSAGYLWNETSWPGILRKHGYFIGHVVRGSKKSGSSKIEHPLPA